MTDYLIPFFTSNETPHRLINLHRCILRLNEQGITPIVGSNVKPDIEAKFLFHEVDIPHFNKCILLNDLITHSTAEKFFILDGDILLPKYFNNFLGLVIDVDSAYFPICYRLNIDKPIAYKGDEDCLDDETETEANGGWCLGGYGLFGIYKEQWNKCGFSYKSEIGRSWGVEDDEMYRQVKSKMKVYRHKCPGLFHIWHPKDFTYKNANHPEKPTGDFHELRREKFKKYMV